MTGNLNDENVVAEMPQNIQRALEAGSIKHIGNHDRQAAAPSFRAICFERGSSIGFAAWHDIAQEPEYLEDPAFATLRRQFVFDLIRERNHVDAIEIGEADVAQSSTNSS